MGLLERIAARQDKPVEPKDTRPEWIKRRDRLVQDRGLVAVKELTR